MDGGPESRGVRRVYGLEGAVRLAQTGKTICCNLTSSAPDDGRMRPKHVEPKEFQ